MTSLLSVPNEVLDIIIRYADYGSLDALSRTSRRFREYVPWDFRELCKRNLVFRRRGESWGQAFGQCYTGMDGGVMGQLNGERISLVRIHAPTGMIAVISGRYAEIRSLDQNARLKVAITSHAKILLAGFVADGKKFIIQSRVPSDPFGGQLPKMEVTSICTETWEVLNKLYIVLDDCFGEDNIIFDGNQRIVYNMRRNRTMSVQHIPLRIFCYNAHRLAQDDLGLYLTVPPFYDYYSEEAEYACFHGGSSSFLVYDYGNDLWKLLCTNEPGPFDRVPVENNSCRVDAYTGEVIYFHMPTGKWRFVQIEDTSTRELDIPPDMGDFHMVLGRDERLLVDLYAGNFVDRGDSDAEWKLQKYRQMGDDTVPREMRENRGVMQIRNRCFLVMQNSFGKYTLEEHCNVYTNFEENIQSLLYDENLDGYTAVTVLQEFDGWHERFCSLWDHIKPRFYVWVRRILAPLYLIAIIPKRVCSKTKNACAWLISRLVF